MRILSWQTILMKYQTLFLSKSRKDVAKFVVCCSRDWPFKGLCLIILLNWSENEGISTIVLN